MRHGIGASPPRREDRRLLLGLASYTADLNRPGQLYLHVVRSPVAHASIDRIDLGIAAQCPGVVATCTANELSELAPLRCQFPVANADGTPMAEASREILARERVRYVGQPVAAIVAESATQARDAAEYAEIELADLPAVMTPERALGADAPLLYDHVPANLCASSELGDRAAVDQAFAEAAHIVTLEHVQNRLVPCPIEPRAILSEYDRGTETFTVHVPSQTPHFARSVYCEVLGIAENRLHLITPEIGGGFGSKAYQYSEEVLALWFSRQLGRPVKWVCERSDAFVADAHGRDHSTRAEAALDASGRLLAIRVHTLANLGAAACTFGPAIPVDYYAPMLAGVYQVPAVHVQVDCVYTNTPPVDAYRGAGRPEATWTVERLIELAASELKIDAISLRRKNFIPRHAFPYTTPTGMVYDSGDYHACLDAVLTMADIHGWAERHEGSTARGFRRGRGLCVYTECAGSGSEVATVRIHPDATVEVLTGSNSHGQGHETTFAQIVCEQLQLPLEQIRVINGDTARVPYGTGTYGSRSISAGGSAAMRSAETVLNAARGVAAKLLQIDAEKVSYSAGVFGSADSNVTLSFAEVASAAYQSGAGTHTHSGLECTIWFDSDAQTFPCGAHWCEIELDPETGAYTIERYAVADEFGTVINPTIVHGQVHGGLAQGIGQAALEQAVFDPDSGQLLTGSLLDYTLPRADDLPAFEVQTLPSHSPTNPLGAKGCGEAGAIGAPIAVVNALLDALRPLRVTRLDMPATPFRVWQAIQKARSYFRTT